MISVGPGRDQVIERGLCAELASTDSGDPLEARSHSIVNVKPFLAAGTKAIEEMHRAGSGLVAERASRWCALQADR